MSSTTKVYDSDVLAPASASETFAYLSELPGGMNRRWWIFVFAVHSVLLIAMVSTTNLLGYSVALFNGGSLPILGSGTPAIVWLVTIVAALIMVETVTRSAGDYILGRKIRQTTNALRRACLNAVLTAPVPEIMALGTGNVITRMTRDIDDVVEVFTRIGVRVIITILIFPFTALSLILVSPWLILPLAITAVIMTPLVATVISELPKATNAMSVAEAHRNAVLLDTLRGLETLRAFGFGGWAVDRLERSSWKTIEAKADQIPWVTRLLFLGQWAYGIWLVLNLITCMVLLSVGWLDVGAASAAVFLVVRAEMHVFNAMFFTGDIQMALTSLGRAVALAKLEDTSDRPTPASLDHAPEVNLRDVSFYYPGGAMVLRGLNLTFKAGTTTALVGTSGAGKSTLAGLLAGLQRPTGGEIIVGGHSSADVSDVWLASTVMLVSQEAHVFAGTLREDLSLARHSATDTELFDALTQAGVGPETLAFKRSFPKGLDTMVGAGADELPAGVIQQIALARVILRNPPVLVLDEATSEAGSDDAQALEAAAINVTKGRTSLVVAHRLDQAMVADRIIVMDHGEIVEDGTHDELVASGGRYATLFEHWSAS